MPLQVFVGAVVIAVFVCWQVDKRNISIVRDPEMPDVKLMRPLTRVGNFFKTLAGESFLAPTGRENSRRREMQ